MEKERIPSEEKVQLNVVLDHLEAYAVLLGGVDHAQRLDEKAVRSIAVAIRHIGEELLDIHPDFDFEREVLFRFSDIMGVMEGLSGNEIRPFSDLLDAVRTRIYESPNLCDFTVRVKLGPDDKPDLADLDLGDQE